MSWKLSDQGTGVFKRGLAQLGRRTRWRWRSNAVGLGAAALLSAVILIALVWTAGSLVSWDVAEVATESTPDPSAETLVRLSTAQLAAADLHASDAQVRELQETRRVPGTIGYNTARRLEVKLPVAGVVKQILARPGQAVKSGDRLAILTSIDVGMARDKLVQSEADAELARKESQWTTQIACHLDELLNVLHGRPDVQDVEEQFDGKILGVYRDRVMSAYSTLLLAEGIAKSTQAVSKDGVVSGLVARQRQSAREVAAAAFGSISEQSKFEASQERARAVAARQHAERLVAVNRQDLNILLGPYAEIASSAADADICELVLRAPVGGLVEDRFVADGTQVVASQLLFVITNTNTLWVSAQIYEREWAALSANKVTEVLVESPAVPDRKVKAKMVFVSVSVSPETRAVPLVAQLPNADGRFKPGMFAWVSVPLGAPHQGLAVPASAITRHEQRAFVFVEENPGTYRRVDVAVGCETPEFVEVTGGLKPGQKVVDRDVFLLKSELLLQGEEP